MARVELAAAVVDDLDALIEALNLPADTRQPVGVALSALQRFPRLGPELYGRWTGLRCLLGPWRWMLVIYAFDEAADRVVVVTIQDARSSKTVRSVDSDGTVACDGLAGGR